MMTCDTGAKMGKNPYYMTHFFIPALAAALSDCLLLLLRTATRTSIGR